MMDNPGRRTRPEEPPTHYPPGSRYSLPDSPQPSRLLGNATAERYRYGQMPPLASAPRGMGSSSTYGSYYPESSSAFPGTTVPSTGMSYGTDYNPEQRQPTSNFHSYNSASMMYNVPQAQTPQTQVYDDQGFGSRPTGSGLQIMTPDVASTYFGTGTPTPSSSSLQQATHAAPGSSSVFSQSTSLNFPGAMPSMNAPQQPATSADGSMDDPEYGENALQTRWLDYKRQMATVFQDINDGSLQNASKTLSAVSEWLLSQVADLGLNEDNASLQAGRLKLWEDFNHAWLALGLKQKEGMLSGQPRRPATLLSRDMMRNMFDGLVRLCDDIEKYGLVDYQYGVWEERIADTFIDCIDLFPEGSKTGE